MSKWISLWNDAGERIDYANVSHATAVATFNAWTTEARDLPGDFVILSDRDPGHDGYPNFDCGILMDSRAD